MRRKLQEYPGILGTATVKLIKNSNAADMNNLCNGISAMSDRKPPRRKNHAGRRTINTGLLSGDASESVERFLAVPACAGRFGITTGCRECLGEVDTRAEVCASEALDASGKIDASERLTACNF